MTSQESKLSALFILTQVELHSVCFLLPWPSYRPTSHLYAKGEGMFCCKIKPLSHFVIVRYYYFHSLEIMGQNKAFIKFNMLLTCSPIKAVNTIIYSVFYYWSFEEKTFVKESLGTALEIFDQNTTLRFGGWGGGG